MTQPLRQRPSTQQDAGVVLYDGLLVFVRGEELVTDNLSAVEGDQWRPMAQPLRHIESDNATQKY